MPEQVKRAAELIRRLRSGHHNADLVTVGGCTHDGRCLSAADEIQRLRFALYEMRPRDDAPADVPAAWLRERVDAALGREQVSA